MQSKYIVIKTGGEEMLFLFPAAIAHNHMFEAVTSAKQGPHQSWSRPYRLAEIVSAGFVLNGRCHGRSESLDVSSRPDIDTHLLERGCV